MADVHIADEVKVATEAMEEPLGLDEFEEDFEEVPVQTMVGAAVEDEPGDEDDDDEEAARTSRAVVDELPEEVASQAKEEIKEDKVPWSLYKKSVSKVKPGVVTGFDVYSEEEQEKRAKRLARWDPDALEKSKAVEADLAEETSKRAARAERFGGNLVPVEWTTLNTWLRPLRLSREELSDESRSQVEAMPCERLHLRVLPVDREAFKRLRSPDIEAHFATYRPTYVEWLGDESCNVWFAEAYTARRALEAMTVAIPEEKWRLLKQAIVKAQHDKWGNKGTHATRLVCRFAADADVLLVRPVRKREGRSTETAKKSRKMKRPRYIAVDETLDPEASGKADVDAPLKARRKTAHTPMKEAGHSALQADTVAEGDMAPLEDDES